MYLIASDGAINIGCGRLVGSITLSIYFSLGVIYSIFIGFY